jgi:ribosomal protein S20
MCCSLFPELETEAMCIPAGKKSNVKTIHKILDKAYQKGILKKNLFLL